MTAARRFTTDNQLDFHESQLDAVFVYVADLPRRLLERLIQCAIDRLDEADGDVDLEPNGDEEDTTGAEDDECGHVWKCRTGPGPGCSISDPGS